MIFGEIEPEMSSEQVWVQTIAQTFNIPGTFRTPFELIHASYFRNKKNRPLQKMIVKMARKRILQDYELDLMDADAWASVYFLLHESWQRKSEWDKLPQPKILKSVLSYC